MSASSGVNSKDRKMVKIKSRVNLAHLNLKKKVPTILENEKVAVPISNEIHEENQEEPTATLAADPILKVETTKMDQENEVSTSNIGKPAGKVGGILALKRSYAVLCRLTEDDMTKYVGPKRKDARIICREVAVEEEVDTIDASESSSLTIYELEQDEVSTPKGSRKEKLPKTPDFPDRQNWIKPEELLEEIWAKRQTLRTEEDKDSDFCFPSDGKLLPADRWEIPELMVLKARLNETKSLIDFLPLQAWHNHTKKMNIADLIMKYVKRYFNPEFSSQAWGKLFEILCTFSVIPQDILDEISKIDENNTGSETKKVPFDTVHLCEAPGAFVSALNHFLKISYPNIDWNWLATTLNPYHEGNDVSKMINDDRLILMSLDHWTFLEDATGNILNLENLKSLIKAKDEKLMQPRRLKGGVPFVTADGSIDCQSNPAEQEAMVAHLQFGEIIAALSLLSVGGSFVLKIFTFLESSTICHLYLLSCVFKEVHFFKPSTSKEGNSEVYVICLGFLGKKSIRHVWQSKLKGKLESYGKLLEDGKVLLPLSTIPEFFIRRVIEAAEFFCNYQIKIILRNLGSFGNDTRTYLIMKPFRMEAAEEWIEFCEIKALPPQDRLFSVDYDLLKLDRTTHLDGRIEQGCFAQKVARAKGSELEKIFYIRQEVFSYPVIQSAQNHVLYGTFLKVGPVLFEKPYQNIRSSRFCPGGLLSDRDELRHLVKPYISFLESEGFSQDVGRICTGHEKKRVYKAMNKSCDVEFDNLDILCFTKLTWDFVSKTDFKQQQEDLTKLFSAVNNIGEHRSIFLCRYPMLTRLQVGLIFCFVSVFEKVIMFADPDRNVIGIMLHRFIGLTRPELKNMMRSISDCFDVLVDEEFNCPILQLVPTKALVDHMPTEFLVRYNVLLINQDMTRSLNVIEAMIHSVNKYKAEGKPGKQVENEVTCGSGKQVENKVTCGSGKQVKDEGVGPSRKLMEAVMRESAKQIEDERVRQSRKQIEEEVLREPEKKRKEEVVGVPEKHVDEILQQTKKQRKDEVVRSPEKQLEDKVLGKLEKQIEVVREPEEQIEVEVQGEPEKKVEEVMVEETEKQIEKEVVQEPQKQMEEEVVGEPENSIEVGESGQQIEDEVLREPGKQTKEEVVGDSGKQTEEKVVGDSGEQLDEVLEEPKKQMKEELVGESGKQLEVEVLEEPKKQIEEELVGDFGKQLEDEVLEEPIKQMKEELVGDSGKQLDEVLEEPKKQIIEELVGDSGKQLEEEVLTEPENQLEDEVLEKPVNQLEDEVLEKPVNQLEDEVLEEPKTQIEEEVVVDSGKQLEEEVLVGPKKQIEEVGESGKLIEEEVVEEFSASP